MVKYIYLNIETVIWVTDKDDKILIWDFLKKLFIGDVMHRNA